MNSETWENEKETLCQMNPSSHSLLKDKEMPQVKSWMQSSKLEPDKLTRLEMGAKRSGLHQDGLIWEEFVFHGLQQWGLLYLSSFLVGCWEHRGDKSLRQKTRPFVLILLIQLRWLPGWRGSQQPKWVPIRWQSDLKAVGKRSRSFRHA